MSRSGLAHPELGAGLRQILPRISDSERRCRTVSIRRSCANTTSAASSGTTLSAADAQAIGRVFALTLADAPAAGASRSAMTGG